MVLRFKSYRGKLVEVIVKSFIKDNLFKLPDGLDKKLQERLDLNLKFETKVFDFETNNGISFGYITFEDEYGVIKVKNFTILSHDYKEIK